MLDLLLHLLLALLELAVATYGILRETIHAAAVQLGQSFAVFVEELLVVILGLGLAGVAGIIAVLLLLVGLLQRRAAERTAPPPATTGPVSAA